jgi:hypothetical protein
MDREEIERYFRDLVVCLRLVGHSIWEVETASRRMEGRSDADRFRPAIEGLYALRTKLELDIMQLREDASQMGIALEVPLGW